MGHLAVIGGGPAGLAAATAAARCGAQVTLVERESPGGRATWHSLLPSKAWLSVADRLAGRDNALAFGLRQDKPTCDCPTLLAHIAALKNALDAQYRTRLAAANVRLIKGDAAFDDPTHIRVQADDNEHEDE
ncbi:FAD-dependent oxidoreductase, partial [Candidatus Uhrbacteria bacterium]|nr:FAD-dependent oxidoreductase [Candidatus Uhrbacteria bacterium]